MCWGEYLPECQLGTKRPQRQIRLAKTWSRSKVSRFKGLTPISARPFWASPLRSAVLLFYAPLCGFKKQFRNCFCNAAHSTERIAHSTEHTAESICSHESGGAPHSHPSGLAAAKLPAQTIPITIPSRSSGGPNNAVVIVVFTSIKSSQLFFPCLPNLARTRPKNGTWSMVTEWRRSSDCYYADSYGWLPNYKL